MRLPRNWAIVPGFFAIALAATILSAYSGASSSQGFAPDQPVDFPHPVHVETLGLNCLYCHYSANKSPDPGMPAVGTCMGCHTIIGPQRPALAGKPARTSEQIQLLQDFAKRNEAIPWVRIHKLPEYVHFPHMRHVDAGVTCQACHGQIQKMERVSQFASLNMGWCVNCHVRGYNAVDGMLAAGYEPTAADSAAPVKKARYDCAVCHY
jgi:hypothetical protein